MSAFSLAPWLGHANSPKSSLDRYVDQAAGGVLPLAERRLRLHQAGLRGCTLAPGFHLGTQDGGVPEAHAADLAWLWSVFAEWPISSSLLIAASILLTIVLLPSVKKKRGAAFVADQRP